MALFARICVRVHSRVPAPTFPPPLYTGGWKWAGVRLGGRVCVCVCVCVCVNGGSGGGGRREGMFYLLQGISTATTARRPRELLSLSPRYLLFAARNKPIPLPAFSYAYAPARLRTHIFPPLYIGGKMGI